MIDIMSRTRCEMNSMLFTIENKDIEICEL